jgi:hypothetical protein
MSKRPAGQTLHKKYQIYSVGLIGHCSQLLEERGVNRIFTVGTLVPLQCKGGSKNIAVFTCRLQLRNGEVETRAHGLLKNVQKPFHFRYRRL